jgi:hypothetical protein
VLCSGTSGCGLSACACNDSGDCRGASGAYTCASGSDCVSTICDTAQNPDTCQ